MKAVVDNVLFSEVKLKNLLNKSSIIEERNSQFSKKKMRRMDTPRVRRIRGISSRGDRRGGWRITHLRRYHAARDERKVQLRYRQTAPFLPYHPSEKRGETGKMGRILAPRARVHKKNQWESRVNPDGPARTNRARCYVLDLVSPTGPLLSLYLPNISIFLFLLQSYVFNWRIRRVTKRQICKIYLKYEELYFSQRS